MIALHVAAGPNLLPAPWTNLQKADADLRTLNRWPWKEHSVDFIFLEHAIEHVEFREGLSFLLWAYDHLKPGGWIRLAFPDVERLWLADRQRAAAAPWLNLGFAESDHLAAERILYEPGHRSAWTAGIGIAALTGAGFAEVIPRRYRESTNPMLERLEGHHVSVGYGAAEAETTILEARK